MTERIAAVVLGIGILGSATAAERVIHNANGYTCTPVGVQRFQSLRIDAAGRVAGVAGDDRWADAAGVSRHDAAGATLLPGLIDAHGHVLWLGRARSQVDLNGATSVAEAVARVASYVRAHPDENWILGRGWNQELWTPRRFPTAKLLDREVPDRPVWLERVDGHAGWANSRAMELAGVTAATAEPPGGHIVRDSEGQPTGIFVDHAQQFIDAQVPEQSPAQVRRALALGLRELSELGLTGVHDAGIDRATLAAYESLAEANSLPLRVYAMLSEDAREALAGPRLDPEGWLIVRSVKLYADGALGSRGAVLLEPYADEPGNRGLPGYTLEGLTGLIEGIAARGFQVNVHAIGDAGNRMVLDAFERALGRQPSALRHRIEHAQVVALEDIPRFRALGIIASMQPVHAPSDMHMAELRLGPGRLAGAYAWRRFLDAGVILAAGSDFPVENANPFHGIHAAVTRTDQADEPEGGWLPDLAMTRAEALCAFTLNAAYAAHMEDAVGSLEEGKWADFIVVDRDPFTVPASELWQTEVLETWVGGVRRYARGDSRARGPRGARPPAPPSPTRRETPAGD